MLESNQHLTDPQAVYNHTLLISKFWSALSEEDREYVEFARYAIEEKVAWNVK